MDRSPEISDPLNSHSDDDFCLNGSFPEPSRVLPKFVSVVDYIKFRQADVKRPIRVLFQYRHQHESNAASIAAIIKEFPGGTFNGIYDRESVDGAKASGRSHPSFWMQSLHVPVDFTDFDLIFLHDYAEDLTINLRKIHDTSNQNTHAVVTGWIDARPNDYLQHRLNELIEDFVESGRSYGYAVNVPRVCIESIRLIAE